MGFIWAAEQTDYQTWRESHPLSNEDQHYSGPADRMR